MNVGRRREGKNMSHQVIITFDLDENKVAENAEKEAGRQIAREVVDSVFGQSYSRQGAMRNYVQQAVQEIFAPEKDRIVAEAIKEVVGTLGRTKAVKERLEKELEDA